MRILWRHYAVLSEYRTALSAENYAIFTGTGIPFLPSEKAFKPLPALDMSDSFWIHFARFGNLGYLSVERETGRIGLVLADGDICFVNSTLRQYVSSFLIFSEGLPYDAIPDEENDDPLLEAAERVKDRIRRIDPPATEWNTFWDDVYWALAEGDWDIV